jgi:hypothetical protein
MAKSWAKFPYADKKHVYTAATLKKAWDRLHRGDQEPFPKDEAVVDAWIAFHAGDFQRAAELGLKAGGAGLVAANKATGIYANYLEENDKTKLALFEQVAERAEQQQAAEPKNANAFYWHAYALGRYAQDISIAKALAAGIGGRVKASLEKTGNRVYPSATNFLWFKPQGTTAAELFASLREQNILTRYFPGPQTGPCLRVTIGTDDQMDAFLLGTGK